MATTLIWNSRFEMGIPILDEQHKTLFGIYLELEELLTDSVIVKEKIWYVIQRLQAYTRYHFVTEENLLREASYKDLEKQVENHKLFIRLSKQFTQELHYLNPLILENMVIFIKKWLLSHILKEDRMYMECVVLYLQSNGESTVLDEKKPKKDHLKF